MFMTIKYTFINKVIFQIFLWHWFQILHSELCKTNSETIPDLVLEQL